MSAILDEDGYLFLSGTVRGADHLRRGEYLSAEIEGVWPPIQQWPMWDVIGVPNEEWGEEVKAVVELREGVEPSAALAEQLIAHCRDSLARYKVPRTVDFLAAAAAGPTRQAAQATTARRVFGSGRAAPVSTTRTPAVARLMAAAQRQVPPHEKGRKQPGTCSSPLARTAS